MKFCKSKNAIDEKNQKKAFYYLTMEARFGSFIERSGGDVRE